jgi:Ca2+-binding EF-hand superfamily protein
MRMTTLATVVSSVLLTATMAHAGESKATHEKITQEQFTAADMDRDGSLTLAEAKTGTPALAAKFSSVDANRDGKISADELSAFNKTGKSMESDEATTPPHE